MRLQLPFHFLVIALTVHSVYADWPQWRGPDRNGVAPKSAQLPDSFPEDYEPVEVWRSIEIPSDHYGGHGSVSVASGKVYLSIVWHRDEPTDTRKIDSSVLSDLGYRGTGALSPEVREKMETDRMNLSRRLRCAALEEWSKKWVEENIDEKTQLSLGSWIQSRFKKGPAAIPLPVYDTLLTVSKKTFADQEEIEAWVTEQNFAPEIHSRILKAIPVTKKVADDVVLCLDAATGKELWRFSTPGSPSGRGSSSTPAIIDGRVFAALSGHLYCVDAESGQEIWRSPLDGKRGPASSPLVVGEKVFLHQNRLTAFDVRSGNEIWNNNEVKGANSSPAVWKNLILSNSQKGLYAVDVNSGATVWSVSGGGDGTPVVSGDHVIVSSKTEGENLIAYRLKEDTGPEKLWSHSFLARRYGSSPIVYDGKVFHLGSNRHLCLSLGTGNILWERDASSAISSPVLADGKLLVYENRGGVAHLLSTSGEEYQSLGRTKVGALQCASPAIVGNEVFLRTKDSVVCYRFEEPEATE